MADRELILALDTASPSMGAALYDGNEILSESVWHSAQHHNVQLAPLIAHLFEWCGESFSALQAVVVATGPGGFTALRIGLALAKGICLAQHAQIIGIPALHAIACAQPLPYLRPARLAAALQAGRGRFVVGWYEAGRAVKAGSYSTKIEEAYLTWGCNRVRYELLSLQQLMEKIVANVHAHPESAGITILSGEFNRAAREYILQQKKELPDGSLVLSPPAQSLRRPAFLAELGWQRWQRGEVDDPHSLAPIYL